jgi:hypothetical protein
MMHPSPEGVPSCRSLSVAASAATDRAIERLALSARRRIHDKLVREEFLSV